MSWNASLKGMLALVLSLGLFAGCSDDDDNPAGPQGPSGGRIMAVHASPDAPGVDLYVDNVKVNTSPLTFPNNTAYLDVAAGNRTVKLTVAGDTAAVLQATATVLPGITATLFAVNALDSLDFAGYLDTLATPAAGKAHVRFIHLSPDAPPVDIGVTGGGVVFGNVTYLDVAGLTPLDAGTYNLEVRLAGTSTVVLPLPGITLQAGKIYTVWAKGFVAGTGAQALGAQIIANN
jgi:hypothetical protein